MSQSVHISDAFKEELERKAGEIICSKIARLEIRYLDVHGEELFTQTVGPIRAGAEYTVKVPTADDIKIY